MDSEPESKLVSLITRLMVPLVDEFTGHWVYNPRIRPFIDEVMSLVRSMDLDSQPETETEFMSLTTQLISLLGSIDLDSQPQPLSKLISLISQSPIPANDFESRLYVTSLLDPEPEVMSLIHQILSLVIAMNSSKHISLSPQVEVYLENGKSQVSQVASQESYNKWECLPLNWIQYSFTGEGVTTYFHCRGCNGVNHKEYKKAPCEIKHTFHPQHSLQLVFLQLTIFGEKRECYCCNEDLKRLFYYCPDCDFAINFVCVKKPVELSKDEQRWHEHPLSLFPRQNSLTCNVCALTHSARSSGPFYMCPSCDFVIHQSCIALPRLIRISRHPHRISFTFSFDQKDLSCCVCRTKIDNKCGGYSCIKDGCSYAAHSKCATQSNVWDGQELYGKPEEEEEKNIEPFLEISDGVIQHFSHQHHHLRLDENTSRDYDDNNQCQACITPVYFGNFYSCMQCDFILHEDCANLFRKMYHPIHPHQLTLVAGYDDVLDYSEDRCSACPWFCKAGFFYECVGCDFQLHVQCATISEPLVHESHMHPLFLTSKPGDEERVCSVCKGSPNTRGKETFNCIECDFALCFKCATWPQKVRYKHDKHTLTLSCGNKTSTMTAWCEICEGQIHQAEWFYMCDEYCCVTLHIGCLFGFDFYDFYMKSSSSVFYYGKKLGVLPNNHHMSRPICSRCKKRCPHKIVFEWSGLIFCSSYCS